MEIVLTAAGNEPACDGMINERCVVPEFTPFCWLYCVVTEVLEAKSPLMF